MPPILKKKKKSIFLWSTVSFIFLSITIILINYHSDRGIRNLNDYNRWLNEEKNGCVLIKKVAGIKISVKYQPPEYLVVKELLEQSINNKSSQLRDSLLRLQGSMATFVMTLGPDDELNAGQNNKESIAYKGIADYKEYAQRVLTTNFSMDQYIKMYVDGVEYNPVLSTVENVYELSSSRNFIIVFALNKKFIAEHKEFLFVYHDPFFEMGQIQFDFAGHNLKKAGLLNISWNNID